MFQPYTYYLYHIPTGKKYYGVRLKPKTSPEHDLWIEYFSSSKKVDELIEKYGKDSFTAKIRKIFNNSVDALLWEQRVICRIKAVERNDWLNQSSGLGKHHWKGSHTDKSKQKMSRIAIETNRIPPSRLGIRHTTEWREQRSKDTTGEKHPMFGKKQKPDNIRKNSEAQKLLASSPTYINSFKGKKHTEETKRINSEKRKEWWRKRKITDDLIEH